MKLAPSDIDALAVQPGGHASLHKRDTGAVRGGGNGNHAERDLADYELRSLSEELAAAQELLYANQTFSLLVVLQGMDAAGKDGTIKHVMSGVNPQGCDVVSFKQPSAEELDHDFLWRAAGRLPGRGRIGIFNRSYYEDVLVVRVHPEMLAGWLRPGEPQPDRQLWQNRYEDINAFERHLDRSGTRVVKVFLHLSRDEQKRRLLERLENPLKYWKFSSSDLAERAYWDQYQRAYEAAITATSTTWAPWYVVPADHKHLARALVAGIIVHAIDRMQLAVPTVKPARVDEIEQARSRLLAD